jgi:histidinol-phosphatase
VSSLEDFDVDAELALAVTLADLADSLTLGRYRTREFSVDWKANRTEVTEVDRATEAALASLLATERPHHGRYGEEHGAAGPADSAWSWVIDPIDGTTNFVRGVPVWATLIALVHAHAGPVVGVVSAPALGRRWQAAQGRGAFVGSQRLAVSSVAQWDQAHVSVTYHPGWDAVGKTTALDDLAHRAGRVRGFGDFWQHMLVAEGALDAAIDAIGVQPYDLAAVQVVVEQAGGTFTDRHGTRTHRNDSALSSNGALHGVMTAALG